MKKNKLFRFFSVAVIAAAMAVTALPATAFADDVAEEPVVVDETVVPEGEAEDIEQTTENEIAVTSHGWYGKSGFDMTQNPYFPVSEDEGNLMYSLDQLLEMDWANMSEEDVETVFMFSDNEDVYRILLIMDEGNAERIKNMAFMKETFYGAKDENGNDIELPYYEWMEQFYDYISKDKVADNTANYWVNGSTYIQIKNAAGTASNVKISISKNVDTTQDDGSSRTLKYSVTSTNNGILSLSGSGTFITYSAQWDQNKGTKKNPQGGVCQARHGVIGPFTFTKADGYKIAEADATGAGDSASSLFSSACTFSKVKAKGESYYYGTNGKTWTLEGQGLYAITANGNGFASAANAGNGAAYTCSTAYLKINLCQYSSTWSGHGTGQAQEAYAKVVKVITPTPITYTVTFPSGPITCTYNQNATAPAGSNTDGDSVTVYYNLNYGNNETYSSSTKKATKSFAYWNILDGTTSVKTVGSGASFTNATNLNGKELTAQAVYNPQTYNSHELPTNPSRTGYDFLGWYTQRSGGTKITTAQSPTSNTTYYAQWKAKDYIISFDNCQKASITATYDAAVNLGTNPTKTGYIFKDWSWKSGEYQGTGNYNVDKNSTATANWTPIKYSVKFNAEGGSQPDEIKGQEYDKELTLPATTRDGYKFKGWTGATLTAGTTGNVKNLTTEDNKTVELTANWEPIKYNVTFDADGGSAVEDIQCTYDDPLVLPTSEKKDYQFGGWMMNAGTSDETIVTTAQNLTTTDGSTVTLKAKWINQVFTAKFESGDGATKVQDTKYKFGETTALPVPTKPDDKKFSYVFDGWVMTAPTDKENYEKATLLKTAQDIKTTDVEADAAGNNTITLYARWTQNPLPQNSGGTNTAVNTQTTTYNNEYGLDIEEAKKWLADLIGGTVSDLNIKGVRYVLYKNSDGTISIKMVDMKNQKELTIPDAIKIGDAVIPITSIDREAFKNNTVLEKVIFGKNVTTIGDSAFEGCKKLKSVTMNEGLVTIGNRAFYGCSALTQIKTPSTVKTIGNSAFENCTKLSKVTLNNGLLDIGNAAFKNCKALTSITIPKSALKIGDSAFEKCTKLKTVKFAKGSNLQSIGKNAFANCTALTKINLPNKLSKLSTKAFYNCKKLSKVTGGKGLVTIGDKAFMNCVKLSKFTIWKKVVTVGKQAFYKDKALKSVTIKSKVLTKVGAKAFKKTHKKIIFTVPNKAKKAAYKKLLRGKY